MHGQAAIDAAGNEDPSPEIRRFAVLSHPAQVAVYKQPLPASSSPSFVLGVGPANVDPVLASRVQFRVVEGNLTSCLPPSVDTGGAASVELACIGVPDGRYRLVTNDCVPVAGGASCCVFPEPSRSQ